MASGIPWPRIRSEPTSAMAPMIRPPTTGIRIVQAPNFAVHGATSAHPDGLVVGQMGDEADEVEQPDGHQCGQPTDARAKGRILSASAVMEKSARWTAERLPFGEAGVGALTNQPVRPVRPRRPSRGGPGTVPDLWDNCIVLRGTWRKIIS